MSLIENISKYLKEEKMKGELRKIFLPIADIILFEIYPYIYVCIFFICFIFMLHLATFFMLLYKKY